MITHKKPIMGTVVPAIEIDSASISPQKAKRIVLLLSASVALMMTGYGIVMPVFARRLGEFGDGVEELGFLTMAFALAQFIGAPIWGGVADRRGRRPMILMALIAVTLSYIGYLFAPNTAVFIVVRAAAGFLTAGLFPAAMGVVSDIIPEDIRARWVGIVMGSYAVGMIFGPALGGFLYDAWGYEAPFILSAIVAFLALMAAIYKIPETRSPAARKRQILRSRRIEPRAPEKKSIWSVLPRPLNILATLLFIDFIFSFGFTFVEPQMVFYFYDKLQWTTMQFGVVVGVYGVVMVLGQMLLGQISDSWGRKPIILLGILLNLFLYVGLATITDYQTLIIGAVVAGLGSAISSPAISAFYMDISNIEHRSRIIGIKESSLALGGVLGPLGVAAIVEFTTPQGIFWIASVLGLVSLLVGLVFLREPKHRSVESPGVQDHVSAKRALAAQASLRGIVLRAYATRSSSI